MPGEGGEKHKRDKDKERNASAMVSATYIYTPPGAPPTNDKRKKKGEGGAPKGQPERAWAWVAGCTRVLYFLFSLVLLNIAEKRKSEKSRRESKLIFLSVAGGYTLSGVQGVVTGTTSIS